MNPRLGSRLGARTHALPAFRHLCTASPRRDGFQGEDSKVFIPNAPDIISLPVRCVAHVGRVREMPRKDRAGPPGLVGTRLGVQREDHDNLLPSQTGAQGRAEGEVQRGRWTYGAILDDKASCPVLSVMLCRGCRREEEKKDPGAIRDEMVKAGQLSRAVGQAPLSPTKI
jgi:hypothetical protein